MIESIGQRRLPLLLLLFVSTGCAALIYEVVWFQMLQLVIGSSAISLGILLGTFMGGMCLGSLTFPRLVGSHAHPLRVYAVLELGIAASGAAVLLGLPFINRVYAAAGAGGMADILLRGAICGLCLLVPTFLMGASLPAISRWVEATPRGMSWLGLLYGGNIAGAVLGSLLAGFWLLRLYDNTVATVAAVAINVSAAAISLALARVTPYTPVKDVPVAAERPSARTIYVVIAISGFCALAAEVLWTRLLSLILGGTVYTFSIILAVFLFGLGLGSSAAAFAMRGIASPRLVLACCQAMLALAIAWSAWMLSNSLPYWPVNPTLASSPWVNFQLDIVRCLWAILPAAILWGASFPLALAAAVPNEQDAAHPVGRMYAANTAGAIAGAVGASMILIPWIGTQHAQRLLIWLSVTAAFLLIPAVRRRWTMGAAAIIIAAVISWNVAPVPWQLVAYGRQLPTAPGGRTLVLNAEGMNASIAVTRLQNVRMFHVSGKVEASSQGQDMRLQRMLGHLPALLHPKPQSVLVVGFGAGVTAGSFVVHPSVQKLVICEIERLIPRLVAPQFAAENYNVLEDPRTELILDDGRHYVLTTHEKFDIITSDPIHPWVKGNAALYTKEYFESCKRRLRPGGSVTQWVPLYESDFETVKSEIATFFEVFPNGTIWGNDNDGEGYDVVLLGQVEDTRIDPARMQRSFEHPRVAESLREAGFGSAEELLATYAGSASDLRTWLRGAQINRDRNLRLHYLAGMAVNSILASSIYDEILRHRRPLAMKSP